MLKLFKNKKGFSLIEMIVVIMIMVVLISIILPNVVGYIRKSQQANTKTAARSIYAAAQNYMTSKLAEGEVFTPDSTLDASVLWSEEEQLIKKIENYEEIFIKINSTGTLVEYVYYKSGEGFEADYPVGESGRVS